MNFLKIENEQKPIVSIGQFSIANVTLWGGLLRFN